MGIYEALVANSHLIGIIATLAIIGFIVLLIIVLLTNKAVKSAGKKKTPKPVAPLPAVPPLSKMPFAGGRLSEYLAVKGFYKVSELSLLFLRGVEFLRKQIDLPDGIYKLPWYLMIGSADSGKTTLIKNSNVKLPVGMMDFGGGHHPDIQWWFLNKGVVLDIKGNFFINHHDTNSNDNGWRSLLALLARYRARRPIDGIILTLPAHELIGKDALTDDQIADRARIVGQKLFATQQSLGLQLPIYVVITKSDLIPGFKSLCKELPKENQGNLLGWSSPYALNTVYTNSWLTEAFSFIHECLQHLKLEIFSNGRAEDTADGIFIFPSQLQGLKEKVEPYFNHIFKNTAYADNLVLRGLYFTGDGFQHNISENLQTSDLKEVVETDKAPERDIYFFDDVLLQKIFKETGLAQPVYRRVASANRNLRTAKISTAVLACICTYGLINSYHKFRVQNDDLLPVLSKINIVLNQVQYVQGTDSGETVRLFDAYAKQLLQMMHTISDSQFSSIFMPPSWFSQLHQNLRHSLKLSYNHIIIRTIYIDLLLKGRELLYLRPLPTDRSTTITQVINPALSSEYGLLASYVSQMSEFVRMVEHFNELPRSSDITPLRELVRYAFKIELPKSFEDEFHHFRADLRDISFPPIDLEPYRLVAQDTLRTLYKFYIESTLSLSDPLSLVGRLNGFLWQFGQKQNNMAPNLQNLREFVLELDKAVPTMAASGKSWMDEEFYNPSPDFVNMIGQIHDSSFLGGKEMVALLAQETAALFNAFKAEMIRLLPLLSEETLVAPVGALKTLHTPSQVLTSLYKGLSALFKETFMATPSEHQLITIIPQNKVVYWDAKMIELAEQMVKNYETYKTKNLLLIPATLREGVLQIAQQNLQINILSTLAKAQTFVDAPRNVPVGIAAEEILRTKILNVKEVAPKFITLLETLKKGNIGEAFVSLRNMVAGISLNLLEMVENAAMSSPPYGLREKSFSWWDGNKGAIYQAYNVKDDDGLKHYLGLQRDRMKHWALDYAKHMVDFLTSEVMTEANFNRALVERWRRIIDQVVLTDQKKPDTSIVALEASLLKHNDVTIKTCFTDLKLKEAQETSGDFFIAVKNMVVREMLARCEVLARKDSFSHYKELADLFNSKLKSKFPFVANLGANTGEAEPEDIREFFDKYREFGDSPEKILQEVAELGSVAAEPLRFLKAMQKVKEFFSDFLQTDAGNDKPSFDISVDFRAEKGKEQNANAIVDLYIKPSDSTQIGHTDKIRDGKWTVGEPIEWGFVWAEGIDTVPVLDESQKFMSVSERTASFTYSQKWSLLWMLRLAAAPRQSVAEPTPYLIQFVIPLGVDKKTVVFNRITVRAPAKGKGPGKVIDVPVFPSSAPELSSKLKEVEDVPVITTGKVMKGAPDQEDKDDKKKKKKEEKKDDKKEEKKEEKKKDGGGE